MNSFSLLAVLQPRLTFGPFLPLSQSLASLARGQAKTFTYTQYHLTTLIMQDIRWFQLGSAVKTYQLFAQNWTEKTEHFIFANTIVTVRVLHTEGVPTWRTRSVLTVGHSTLLGGCSCIAEGKQSLLADLLLGRQTKQLLTPEHSKAKRIIKLLEKWLCRMDKGEMLNTCRSRKKGPENKGEFWHHLF